MTNRRLTDGAIVDELFVAEVWERQAYSAHALQHLGLTLIFRGIPSDAGGPDYQDAIFSRDPSSVIAGDVEFHVHASDWRRHGHHENPAYNRVVLHVVWAKDDDETIRQDGQSIPVLQLADCVRPPTCTPPGPQQRRLQQNPCIADLQRLSPEKLKEAIREAAMRGLRERAERFSIEASVVGLSQTLYAALLESMGYASNRTAFARLAQSVPYHWLMTFNPQDRAAILLYAAGLTSISPVPCPVRLKPETWRLERLRPANHPALRIQGVAELVRRFPPLIADSVVDASVRAKSATELRRKLEVRDANICFIGPGRADEILASVILPFVSAVEREGREPHRLFETCKSPPANRWTRFMTGLLAAAGHDLKVQSAVEHQGLHHLYHGHCRYRRRDGCPVCWSA